MARLLTLSGHVIDYASSEKTSSVRVGRVGSALGDRVGTEDESNRCSSVWRSGSLRYEDCPRPEPNWNEALVRVIASGVNPADPLIIFGKYAKEFGTHLPLIPGYDIAGVVEKLGRHHKVESRRCRLRLSVDWWRLGRACA